MRRPPHRHWHHHGPGGGAGGGPFGLLLLLGGVLLAGVLVVGVLVLLFIFLVPFLLAGMVLVAVRANRHRSPSRAAVTWSYRWAGPVRKPVTARGRAGADRTTTDWAAARARFAELRGEYGQFECDPLAVLRLPALTDVTVPSTGRFVDAFAEAQALDTDTEPGPAHQARYAAAVEQAWRAWRAALEAAERIRLARIPAQERATVQRAIKLLTMARDSDHDAERATAYARARAELAKLAHTGTMQLPPAAAAALDAAARGQLPPAAAAG